MRFTVRAVLAGVLLAHCHLVLATFHEWKIEELYSNPSGTVQFIELADDFDGETFLQNITLHSAGHNFTFPAGLPTGTPTAHHKLLLATPGYFALSGVPAADYNLGVSNFFSTTGDTLVYAGGLDSLAFSAAQLPTDALHALVRATPGGPLTTAVDSPEDVAGNSGAISRWENQNNRFDVSGSNGIGPQDLVQLVNELAAHGAHPLADPAPGATPPPFYDVNGNGAVSPQDLVQLVNQLLEPGATSQSAVPLSLPLAEFSAVPEPPGSLLAICGSVVMLVGWCRARTPWKAGDASL